MRTLLVTAFLLGSASAMAAATPSVSTSVDEDNNIFVSFWNNDNVALECKYSISYLVNTLNYKRQYGEFTLPLEYGVAFKIKNDPYDRLSRIHASVHCE